MDWYTCVEIKSESLKSFVYWGLLAGTPLIMVFNVIVLPKGFKKSFGIIIPTLVLLYIFLSNPLVILFNKDNWKTQTIIYKSRTSHNKTIEYQMQDKGALGYNRRTVQVNYIAPLLVVIHTPPQNYKNYPDWIKADKDIN